MNQEEIKKLLELYEQGLTSSEQEAILRKHLGRKEDQNHLWFKYLHHHKIYKPDHFENQIWSAIQAKEQKKTRFILRTLTIAASAALIITILWLPLPFLKHNAMSDEEKSAILKEVLIMFSSAEKQTIVKEILYEDESIIIYTQNQKP